MNLRHFSKLTCFSTLFLIFAGGMVTSTGSGLAVPDWPLSYGMLFPPMVGGVFYEHGHRMIASVVGLFMLILAVWLWAKETRLWVKVLGSVALLAVIIQGILGGITVLYYLPTPVSVSHGVLAQTFFILTIILAYSQSNERNQFQKPSMENRQVLFLKCAALFVVLVFLQLIFGAIMRHTGSGLAIYDFPTMAGSLWPSFTDQTLLKINDWRFMNGFDLVTRDQVIFHFLHRAGALIICIMLVILNIIGFKAFKNHRKILNTILGLDILIVIQVTLGIATVLSLKDANVTSFHVVTGAATLGFTVLLILRVAPLSWSQFKQCLLN